MRLKVTKIVRDPIYSVAGTLMDRPRSDFADPENIEKCFPRIRSGYNYCEYGSPDLTGLSPTDRILRLKTISMANVCGVIVGAMVTVTKERVQVVGEFRPYGAYAAIATDSMHTLPELALGARFVLDGEGKILTVEAWDLVVELAE
ncbi:hypothetical protein pEaSNUABM11_00147 [Erwinia phage pEa_SNUABM_11]|nr:hypothetical protein pEaSNUABM11_00147 [Erwinia phage pEa_SNUABM_11]